MNETKRIQIRPVKTAGVLDKKFQPVAPKGKRVTAKTVHPLVVIADLRRGSLASLDRYIAQQQGIPDREVALELRKLISGSRHRSDYRMIVIDHPDKPKNVGGRRSSKNRRPTKVEFEVARDLRDLKRKGEVEAAVATVMAKHKLKKSAVYGYAERVAKFEAAESVAMAKALERERHEQEALLRRAEALKNLRNQNSEQGE